MQKWKMIDLAILSIPLLIEMVGHDILMVLVKWFKNAEGQWIELIR